MAGDSVTARDVAREAAVSVGTVSRVLNNHGNVAPDLRIRVLKAAQQLGYALPNPPAPGRPALTKVGFLFSPINDDTVVASNPYWSHILAGVEQEALKWQITLVYRSINTLRYTPADLARAVQELHVGGALLVGPAPPAACEALASLHIPIVQVGWHTAAPQFDCLATDDFNGAYQATAYLVAQGHQHIAFVNGPLLEGTRPHCTLYEIEQRAQGYRAALIDAGLPVQWELLEGSDLTPRGGYLACRCLLERSAPFTALFCANDSTAIGALRALREAGQDVPDSISVIGYGNDMDIVEHVLPALTTVAMAKEALGAMALKRLLSRAVDPAMPAAITLLPVTLVKRESVMPRSTQS